uniref:Uncharacterized protein n=1 Tax=Pseudoalteromonas undina TaxID=43660 RepID=A0ABN0NMY3_9GAMM
MNSMTEVKSKRLKSKLSSKSNLKSKYKIKCGGKLSEQFNFLRLGFKDWNMSYILNLFPGVQELG